MNGVPLSRWITFWSLAIVGCALDLASKYWMFDWLGMPGGRPYWLVDGIFGFETSLNDGALFGLGKGKVLWFAGLSVVAAIGINYWLFVARAALDRWLTVALGCIMGGVLGNLYDRLGLWAPAGLDPAYAHAVRDWILFRYGEWTWPNFNLADSFLVCGAGMLCWHALRTELAQRKANAQAANGAGEQRIAGA
jgi:signal peptidase II